jgi:hypothetical protein
MAKLFYRYSDDGTYRVWRGDWFGDQFQVLTVEEFEKLKWACDKMGIILKEQYD